MAFRPIVITVVARSGAAAVRAARRAGRRSASRCPRGAVPRSARWALTDQRGRARAGADHGARSLGRRFGALAAGRVPGRRRCRARRASTRWRRTTPPSPPAAASRSSTPAKRCGSGPARRRSTCRAAAAAFFAARRRRTRRCSNRRRSSPKIDAARATSSSIQRTTVERAGALRAVIRLDGELVDAPRSSQWLDATLRLHFFAGLGTVKAELSVTNPRAARHPGGAWDLGDAGSVLIRDLSIDVVPAHARHADVWGSLDAQRSHGAGRRSASRSTRNRAAARTGSTSTT